MISSSLRHLNIPVSINYVYNWKKIWDDNCRWGMIYNLKNTHFTARQRTEINGRNNCSFGVDMSSVNNQVKRIMGNSAQWNERWSSGVPHRVRASWGQSAVWAISFLPPNHPGLALISLSIVGATRLRYNHKQWEEKRGHRLMVCGVWIHVWTSSFWW